MYWKVAKTIGAILVTLGLLGCIYLGIAFVDFCILHDRCGVFR